MDKLNRRDALRLVGVGMGTIFAYGAARETNADDATASPAKVEGADAWKYALVDPDKVAKDAYEQYPVGRCMHTTFMAIVKNVGEALAAFDPLASAAMLNFPFHMMKYGDSGANGWGSLCGSLNGAMAAVALFCADSAKRKAILDELGNYYERTMLPIFKPEGGEETPRSISNSILCHVSSGKWISVAKVRSDSPERTERCSRLSADVAKKTAELLNLYLSSDVSDEAKAAILTRRPEPVATCVKCHNKGGETSDVIGKMTCNECHPEKSVDHHQ